jgi:hypothetical protein
MNDLVETNLLWMQESDESWLTPDIHTYINQSVTQAISLFLNLHLLEKLSMSKYEKNIFVHFQGATKNIKGK